MERNEQQHVNMFYTSIFPYKATFSAYKIVRSIFYSCIYLNGEIFVQLDIRNSILYGKTLTAAHTAPPLLVLIAKHIKAFPKEQSCV